MREEDDEPTGHHHSAGEPRDVGGGLYVRILCVCVCVWIRLRHIRSLNAFWFRVLPCEFGVTDSTYAPSIRRGFAFTQ